MIHSPASVIRSKPDCKSRNTFSAVVLLIASSQHASLTQICSGLHTAVLKRSLIVKHQRVNPFRGTECRIKSWTGPSYTPPAFL